MHFPKGTWLADGLLRLLEVWKTILDIKEYVIAVLMYLSKAFEFLSIWSAYYFTNEAVLLLKMNQFESNTFN